MRDFKPIVKVSRTSGPYTREENRVPGFRCTMRAVHAHTDAPGNLNTRIQVLEHTVHDKKLR